MTKTVFWEKFETVVIVTVIAALVWLYAYEHSLHETTKQIRIAFVAPPSQQLAIEPRGLASDSPTISATIKGSTIQLSQVNDLLSKGPIQIVVNAPTDGSSAERQIFLKEALLHSPLGSLGVSILETTPRTVSLKVEPLLTIRLPVKVETGDAQLASVSVQPQDVAVTLPADLKDAARNEYMTARLSDIDLSSLDVNVPHTQSLALHIPAAFLLQQQWVTVVPDHVSVTFTIRKQTDTVTLKTVPIHINASPLVLQQYDVQLLNGQLSVPDVQLSGPADVIDRIRKKQTKVWAELWPSTDELDQAANAKTPVSLPAHMHVPATVTVESPLPQVQVQVKRKPKGNG